MIRLTATFGLFLPLVATAACTVGPDYELPKTAIPETFSASDIFDEAEVEREVEASWWVRLDDPVLSDLIARARDANLDLEEAAARLRASRALLGLRESDYWPTGSVGASVSESEPSAVETGGAASGSQTIWSASLDASWEVDLFGRVRRGVEARSAGLDASIADLRGAFVAVTGEIGRTYFELRGTQRRLEVSRENVRNQEESLEIVESLVRAGRGTDLDSARARSQLEATRAGIPALEAVEARARHRLAVLVGEAPGALDAQLAPVDGPVAVPDRIELSDPAALLRRRPDVAAAERRLAAATAEIGVATADLFPRITLTGFFGALAVSADELTDGDSRTSSLGPFLRWSVFDLGRIRNRIRVAEADADAALARYRRSVLLSLEETENALVQWDRFRRRQVSLVRAADAAREAAQLASLRYEAGLTDFLAVLDAEARLLGLEDSVAGGEADVGIAWVAIHQAVAGGWDSPFLDSGNP
jgi:multidrug efflux system outer membrane protein